MEEEIEIEKDNVEYDNNIDEELLNDPKYV